MFAYLQMFLVLSLITVVGLLTTGGYYLHTVATDNLQAGIAQNNENLTQGYINAVWRKYRDVVVPLSNDPSRLAANPQVMEFAKDTIRYFQHMPLMRVNIYSSTGLLLMTDNIAATPKPTWSGASPDKAFVVKHLAQMEVKSQIVYDVALEGADHGKILQTLVPIHLDNQPTEAVIEVLFDITGTWGNLSSMLVTIISVAIGGFIAFLLVISFSSRKAEAIIAKQHEANIELTQTAAAAMAENQDKSQFLTNISHELRTPLNAIIGFSDIIKMELLPKLSERKYDQYVNDIHSAGVHLLSLINDILDYSKAEAGKLALEVSEVDVTKMVQNCLRLVSPRAESGEVKLIEEMPKEHIIMVIDSKKFKQVLLNLLSNAVKFTPAGGTVSVTAWLNMLEDTVTFVVQDTGIGIAPKDISRAMTPFGQVDNTLKRKYEGTGLGLPLTKKFVEIMGGKFNIESVINKGTKVIFTIPRETKARDGIIVKQVA